MVPYKYLQEKGIAVKKQKYRVSNWSEYNASLKQRGDIETWLSQEVIDNWYVSDRIYDGTGTPDLYQVDETIEHFTGDGAYNENTFYEAVLEHSPTADVVILPDRNAVYSDKNNEQRNRNILEIMLFGRMVWQRLRKYGKRNYSELVIHRYKRILGNTLQAREFVRQKQESIIGCGVLNKMTSLGMPESYRVA